MFYKKIMLFVHGIQYNKKYVKMKKTVFHSLIYTLLYDWDKLDEDSKKKYLTAFEKILDK